MKEVYLKGLELQAWRSALLNELLLSKDGQGLGPGYQKRVSLTKAKSARMRSVSQWEDYSTDMRKRILQSVGSHLEIVLDLSKEIKRCLWSNIERLSDVAARSPAELVTTFEVIEMHQVDNIILNDHLSCLFFCFISSIYNVLVLFSNMWTGAPQELGNVDDNQKRNVARMVKISLPGMSPVILFLLKSWVEDWKIVPEK